MLPAEGVNPEFGKDRVHWDVFFLIIGGVVGPSRLLGSISFFRHQLPMPKTRRKRLLQIEIFKKCLF